jgi:hypothetical protein
MEKDEKQITDPQDEQVFKEASSIFSQADLRELINYIYNEYQYKGAQYKKLAGLNDYLPANIDKLTKPDLVLVSKKLEAYFVSFDDFLQRNFRLGRPGEDGDDTYYLNIQETGFETESFLIEFQTLAMDIEKAYSNYQAAFMNRNSRT